MRTSAALAVLILSCLSSASLAGTSALSALSMEHFRDTATVTDDPAANLTTISTERGYVEGSGPMREVWHDEFLVATIGHATGQRSFHIEVSTTYSGSRRSYRDADLEAMAGPKSVPATVMRTESVNCAVSECIYTDHVAIPVDEALLRRLAAEYRPGNPTISSFQLNPTRGRAYRGELSNAEIAGLLAKVDGNTAAAPAASPPPRHLNFGISGFAVAPAADRPNRAGVLVSAVAAGSVAQRAGIITGDIIFQIDGRPTRSIEELETALNSNPNRSSAAIKLFRGLEVLALEALY
jgi:hypothetical protein